MKINKKKLDDPLYITKKIKELDHEILRIRREKLKETNETIKLDKQRGELRKILNQVSKGVAMSDHALVRYAERALKINLEEIRKDIIDQVSKMMLTDGRYPLGNGLFAIIRKKTIVTVMDEKTDFLQGDF